MALFFLISLSMTCASSSVGDLASSSSPSASVSTSPHQTFFCSDVGEDVVSADAATAAGAAAAAAAADAAAAQETNEQRQQQQRGLGLFLYLLGLFGGLIMYTLYKPDGPLAASAKRRDSSDSNASDEWTRKRDFRSLSFYAAWLGFEPEGTTFTHFKHFTDRFNSFNEVRAAMFQAGLSEVQIILGIDFTASNEWQGRKSFHGNSLHTLTGSVINRSSNPYQRVLAILGEVLEPFTRGGKIHAYGFGDTQTKDHGVFFLHRENRPCNNFSEVLKSYNQRVKRLQLSGPTSYAPLINRAIEEVEETKKYHILVIIADGQMPQEGPSIDALVKASSHPLSIIMVGVGDGPWNTMEDFDDKLPSRLFDNFQFVNFSRVTHRAKNPETNFALNAFMEIPDQYKAIQNLGLDQSQNQETEK